VEKVISIVKYTNTQSLSDQTSEMAFW